MESKAMGQKVDAETTVTTSPPTPAPQFLCPMCARPLVYRQTIVRPAPIGNERWDYYECRTDGPYQYSHHTRVLRGTTISVEQSDAPDRVA